MHIDSPRLTVEIEKWPLVKPFRITGYTWHMAEALVVTLEKDGRVGRGEAAGVYYRNEHATTLLNQIEALRSGIEAGVSRESVQHLLPPGGARNALDCAVWDLEAKLCGRPAWQLAGLQTPQPLVTTLTCGADTPERMAAAAREYQQVSGARAIKLKLTGEATDAERVRAVREVVPDVWIGVDANQGFTRASLEQLMPVLTAANVALIEQPFPVGQEGLFDGFESPVPIAADESVQRLADLSGLHGRFQAINIKLDKCGGVTEGLAMARAARELGLEPMVGNMIGTSLAMAPAYLVGQLCNVVDLDGPVILTKDRVPGVQYADGHIVCPESVWGW